MDDKTKEIINKAKVEFSGKVEEKAARFRENEEVQSFTIDSIGEMWGEFKKETNNPLFI